MLDEEMDRFIGQTEAAEGEESSGAAPLPPEQEDGEVVAEAPGDNKEVPVTVTPRVPTAEHTEDDT